MKNKISRVNTLVLHMMRIDTIKWGNQVDYWNEFKQKKKEKRKKKRKNPKKMREIRDE
jgi:hypothetical protein